MYHDRKEVRETPLPIRVSEYDLERLQKLLESFGGQKHSRAYQAFLKGLEVLEKELQEKQIHAA
ncbi:MAG: hypothetical protein MI864_00205 [Pseudomonadales bacterium]|nr:hypothetical protein [Pseudomonadales bacterium]